MYYFMLRQQGGGKQMMNFGRSRARLQVGDANKVTFADVAGGKFPGHGGQQFDHQVPDDDRRPGASD